MVSASVVLFLSQLPALAWAAATDADCLLQNSMKIGMLKEDDAEPDARLEFASMPRNSLLSKVERMMQDVATEGAGSNSSNSSAPVRDLSKVRLIKSIVTDILMPGLTEVHSFAETRLKDAKHVIDKCITSADATMAVVKSMNISTSNAEKNHSQCRNQEKTMAADKKKKCDELKDFMGTLDQLMKCPPVDKTLENMAAYFAEQMRLKSLFDGFNSSCNTSTEDHTAQSKLCDGQQTIFESDFCVYRTKIYDTDESFTSCYASANESYTEIKAETEKEVLVWKSEYTAIKKIECYLNVWLIDDNLSTVNKTFSSSCKTMTPDDTVMDLSYPSLPEAAAMNGIIDSNISLVEAYPGSNGFLDRYDSLSTHNSAVAPCLMYTTTTTTTTTTTQDCYGVVGHTTGNNGGTNMAGNNIGSNDECDCLAKCKAKSGCVGYVYMISIKGCWLKSSWGKMTGATGGCSADDCFSGVVSLSPAQAVPVIVTVTGYGTSVLNNPISCGSGEMVATQSGPHGTNGNCEAYDQCRIEVDNACQVRVWLRDRCASVRHKYGWSSYTSTSAQSGSCDMTVKPWEASQNVQWSQNVAWVSGATSASESGYKRSSVCSGLPRNCAKNVMDGDNDTVWHCNKASPCQISFDLQTSQHVIGFKALSFQGRARNAVLKSSTDGDSWTTNKAITTDEDDQVAISLDVSARYWKLDSITVTEGTNNWPGLKEVWFQFATQAEQ